jgi:hypothetical protein
VLLIIPYSIDTHFWKLLVHDVVDLLPGTRVGSTQGNWETRTLLDGKGMAPSRPTT